MDKTLESSAREILAATYSRRSAPTSSCRAIKQCDSDLVHDSD